jgi:hypothetical protein
VQDELRARAIPLPAAEARLDLDKTLLELAQIVQRKCGAA